MREICPSCLRCVCAGKKIPVGGSGLFLKLTSELKEGLLLKAPKHKPLQGFIQSNLNFWHYKMQSVRKAAKHHFMWSQTSIPLFFLCQSCLAKMGKLYHMVLLAGRLSPHLHSISADELASLKLLLSFQVPAPGDTGPRGWMKAFFRSQ